MSIFKKLSSNNISYRSYYSYKNWVLTDSDDNLKLRGAVLGNGYFDPNTADSQSGVFNWTLYNSIKHLYYNSSSIDRFISENWFVFSSGSYSGSIDYYESNFGPNDAFMYKNLSSSAVVISIPQQYFGETIKPYSLKLEQSSAGYTLYDDGYGNIYDYTNSASFASDKSSYTIGNAFYEHGNIVITDTTYHNITESSTATVSFESKHKIYEMEAYCTSKAGEFSWTYNPTVLVSGSSYALPHTSGSEFCTYVTTIGLYNDQDELIAVGKLPQPLRNDPNLDITYVIRLDW